MRPDQLGVRHHPDAVAPGSTRVYLALCALHAEKGSASMDRLARRCGLSRSGTTTHLIRLRQVGLVSWEPDKRGTLRPLYGEPT